MPSAIGPYDGRRARRKRYSACVKRKIKCRGGTPCEHCKRMEEICELPPKSTIVAPVFVAETISTMSGNRKAGSLGLEPTDFPLLQVPTPRMADRNVPYFFTEFLTMNNLTSDRLSVTDDLVDMMKDDLALRATMTAVAAYHRKQHGPPNALGEETIALQEYGQSVHSIQGLIASNTFLDNPSALWTTLFLGLFEVTDTRFDRNSMAFTFFIGTCTLLKVLKPKSLIQPGIQNLRRHTFFLNARIFEISRSLIYSSPTFLWEPKWDAVLQELWKEENIVSWHPKEALFDILPAISELSIRALNFAHSSMQPQQVLAQLLADEGFIMQIRLYQWWTAAQLWEMTRQDPCTTSNMPFQPGTEPIISYAYYHAISIYFSGTYDYHVHWTAPGTPCAPILMRDEIDWHVSQILHYSRQLLAHGIAGIFLFFPLRVAGPRAVDAFLKDDILSLFQETSKRGFSVAEALIRDLSDLWAIKRR